MILLNIVWPTFALVALIFTVLITLLVKRLAHISRVPPRAEDFATRDAANSYFAPVDNAAANLANLFETPVLYFALVPLLILTGGPAVGRSEVVLAWIFVLLRAAHSFIHIGRNQVATRFRIYIASIAILSAMWIGFFINMVGEAVAYHQATSAVATTQ